MTNSVIDIDVVEAQFKTEGTNAPDIASESSPKFSRIVNINNRKTNKDIPLLNPDRNNYSIYRFRLI